jgi:hypothetical protein
VCGEAAADPALAVALVGLGVSSLSMTPRLIPAVADVIARVSYEECQTLAASRRLPLVSCWGGKEPDSFLAWTQSGGEVEERDRGGADIDNPQTSTRPVRYSPKWSPAPSMPDPQVVEMSTVHVGTVDCVAWMS